MHILGSSLVLSQQEKINTTQSTYKVECAVLNLQNAEMSLITKC